MPVVIASSFADPADVAAYHAARRRGVSETGALELGDNGVGAWGDVTARADRALCALPPEDIVARWGTVRAGRGKRVKVTYRKRAVIGELRDTMPARRHIRNGAGIDLNPGFAKAFHVRPPFLLKGVQWEWADDAKPASTGLLQWLASKAAGERA